MIRVALQEARPKQWGKNVLVFAAPGAAGVLDDGAFLVRSLVLFVAMCLASSGTYYWNDLLDMGADRLHPVKRLRPIASGSLAIAPARLIGTVLLVAGIGAALLVRWQAGLVVAGYVVLTLTYSIVLKHVAVLDLVVVAAGFLLRAIAGAEGVHVVMSTWFVLAISFGSLFIVTGKRYAELRELGDQAAQSRAALDDYSLGFLRIVLSVALGATMVTYCIWAFDTTEISQATLPFYELSIVPMVTALLRYTLILEQGHGAAPEEIFAADRALQVLGLGWLLVFGFGVYVG